MEDSSIIEAAVEIVEMVETSNGPRDLPEQQFADILAGIGFTVFHRRLVGWMGLESVGSV